MSAGDRVQYPAGADAHGCSRLASWTILTPALAPTRVAPALDHLPHGSAKRIVQSWDIAMMTGDANDYSVCTTWWIIKADYYLVDVFRARLQYPDLRRKLTKALNASELPEYLANLKAYAGNAQTRLALELLLLTWVRSGELRGARWNEFDIDAGLWTIPGERMKMDRDEGGRLSIPWTSDNEAVCRQLAIQTAAHAPQTQTITTGGAV